MVLWRPLWPGAEGFYYSSSSSFVVQLTANTGGSGRGVERPGSKAAGHLPASYG